MNSTDGQTSSSLMAQSVCGNKRIIWLICYWAWIR